MGKSHDRIYRPKIIQFESIFCGASHGGSRYPSVSVRMKTKDRRLSCVHADDQCVPVVQFRAGEQHGEGGHPDLVRDQARRLEAVIED